MECFNIKLCVEIEEVLSKNKFATVLCERRNLSCKPKPKLTGTGIDAFMYALISTYKSVNMNLSAGADKGSDEDSDKDSDEDSDKDLDEDSVKDSDKSLDEDLDSDKSLDEDLDVYIDTVEESNSEKNVDTVVDKKSEADISGVPHKRKFIYGYDSGEHKIISEYRDSIPECPKQHKKITIYSWGDTPFTSLSFAGYDVVTILADDLPNLNNLQSLKDAFYNVKQFRGWSEIK